MDARALLQNMVFIQKSIWRRRPEPERRSDELPEARRRRREGASGAGRGWGVACASAGGLGGGFSAGAAGLEFASKGIRKEFWNSLRGNSKGTGTVMKVLRVVSGTSCNHHLAFWDNNDGFVHELWDNNDGFKPSTP